MLFFFNESLHIRKVSKDGLWAFWEERQDGSSALDCGPVHLPREKLPQLQKMMLGRLHQGTSHLEEAPLLWFLSLLPTLSGYTGLSRGSARSLASSWKQAPGCEEGLGATAQRGEVSGLIPHSQGDKLRQSSRGRWLSWVLWPLEMGGRSGTQSRHSRGARWQREGCWSPGLQMQLSMFLGTCPGCRSLFTRGRHRCFQFNVVSSKVAPIFGPGTRPGTRRRLFLSRLPGLLQELHTSTSVLYTRRKVDHPGVPGRVGVFEPTPPFPAALPPS